VTPEDGQMVAEVMLEAIDRALAPVLARIALLEARPAVKYSGVYQAGVVYSAGSLTTRSGSLWIASRETHNQPGSDDSGWTLVVKRGEA